MQPNPGRAFGENRIGYTIILVPICIGNIKNNIGIYIRLGVAFFAAACMVLVGYTRKKSLLLISL